MNEKPNRKFEIKFDKQKKAKVTITFNVCDDFEAGKCSLCPYQTRTYFKNHYISEIVKCSLGYTNVTCPVEILEKGDAE